jgi:hypothetical protein
MRRVAVWAGAFVFVISGSALASGGAVGSVSNPPLLASKAFTLRISGSARRVTLYLAHFRHRTSDDLKVGTRTVNNHSVQMKLPRSLAAGAYFVIACPPRQSKGCASSHKPTLVLPAASSLPSGTAAPAAGGASKTIGESGGTLASKGPAATFTLAVPARSLANDAIQQCTFVQQFGFWRRSCPGSGGLTGSTVTLTPLRSLSGLGSLGRFVAGVQLGPEGSPLIHGATVTVTLAQRIPKKRLVVVAYAGTGSTIHEVPFSLSQGRLVVALGEIGGGLAVLERPASAARDAADPAPARTATASAPVGDTAFYDQLIGGLVGELRDSGHDFGDGSSVTDDVNSALISTLAEWKQDILDNEVPAGLEDDAAAQVAIADLLAQARDAALLGMGDGSLPPQVVKLLAGVYDRAQQRCAQTPGFSLDSIPTILGAYRDLVLAGHPDNVTIPDLLSCMRFKLTFDSTITTTFGGSDHGTQTSEYRVVMPIKSSADGRTLTGQAAGTYPVAHGLMSQDPQQCDDNGGGTVTSYSDELHGNGAIAQVPDFTLPSARIGGPSPKLELQLGSPTETYHLYSVSSNPGCQGSTNSNLPLWSGNFITSHRAEIDGTFASANSYVFALEPGTNATIARQSYDRTYAEGQNTENEHTTITIVHTPGAFTRL